MPEHEDLDEADEIDDEEPFTACTFVGSLVAFDPLPGT
jgi:hypothetical protein